MAKRERENDQNKNNSIQKVWWLVKTIWRFCVFEFSPFLFYKAKMRNREVEIAKSK